MITKKMSGGSLCKKCSKIVCESCSTKEAFEQFEGKKVRVCLVCKLALDRQKKNGALV